MYSIKTQLLCDFGYCDIGISEIVNDNNYNYFKISKINLTIIFNR